MLNGIVALVAATAWIAWDHRLLLEYFYFSRALALTHLVTLGFLTSVMMGVLHRLAPMLSKVEPSSARATRWQLGLFLVGSWGMIAHFWIAEYTGMAWSAICVWAASVVQLWNFRRLFRPYPKSPWVRRFVAASLVHLFLAASLGLALALAKAYALRVPGLAADPLANVFAHAHLAGLGWVVSMVFGFQLELVPTTAGSHTGLAWRFGLLQLGTLGLVVSLLASVSALPAASAVAAACVWQAAGPARGFVRGRTREWELLPLVVLVAAAALGLVLAGGWPEAADPARGRVQLAYGFLGLYGFMVLTIASVAFKLFPVWVWKDRFRSEFGRRPVPGMKELASEGWKRLANVALFAGSVGTAWAIVASSRPGVALGSAVVALGVAAFAANLVRVARWSFLAAEYRPTPSDEQKFREIF